jgi:hypothetical protein
MPPRLNDWKIGSKSFAPKRVFDGVPIHPERRSLTDEVIDRCAICGKPTMLEQAKVTEEGRRLVPSAIEGVRGLWAEGRISKSRTRKRDP